jgi:hypothetical protein
MSRRRLLIAVTGLVVVAAVLAVALISRRGTTQSSPPPIVTAVLHSPRVSGATARTTVQALTTKDAPLAIARQVGSALVTSHTPEQCAAAEQTLASAGTPTSLRETAGQIPDPLASDLVADLVTAEGELLAGCHPGASVSAASVTLLDTAVEGLDTRIKDDGGT